MSDKEKRSFDLQLEKRDDSEEGVLRGHAAVFDKFTNIRTFGGEFQEVIRRGAFSDAENDDVRALFNHDPNFVLGRNKSGTLEMHEDEVGLAIRINPPKTQFASDLMELIGRGDVSQMSFAFQVVEEKWTQARDDEPDQREILKVRLFDISPVTYPAYEGTDIALASRNKAFEVKENKTPLWRNNIRRKKLNLKEREVI